MEVTDELSNYRARIYSSYRTSQNTADDRAIRAPYLRQVITRHIPANRNSKILDLGCGSGTILYFLQQMGYRNSSGVDTSIEQIETARELKIQGVTEGDLFETLQNTPDSSLDVIIAFDVIEHLTKSELLNFADEVYRCLTPRGRWIIHAPNAESPFGAGVRYRDCTHEQAFTRDSLAQLFTVVGFSRIRCYEDKPVPHGLKSSVRRVLWEGIRTGIYIYKLAETGSIGEDSVFSQNLLAVVIK